MPVYLKIEGITGEVTEQNHKQWIEVTSLSSPIARKTPEGSFGNDAIQKGLLVFGNISMTRKVDSATIPLARQTALGKVNDNVEIHVTTPLMNGEVNLIEYKLNNVIFVAHAINVICPGGSAQELSELLELNFAKIEWTYRKYKKDGTSDGSMPGSYDRRTSQGG